MRKKERALEVLKRLQDYYPDSRCSLLYESVFQLLIATVLSAQCTDERVNIVTRKLFVDLAEPKDFLRISLEELESRIRSTGFYKNKSRNIMKCCQVLVDQYDSQIPQTLDALVALPGVGRKTANVILGVGFQVPGMVVDTHVKRNSFRLGLTENTDPNKIEQDLMKVVPEESWTHWGHLLIDLGRDICKARKAECSRCFLADICPKKGVK